MSSNYKYKTFSDFRKANPNEANILKTRGLTEKLCVDMGWKLPKKNKPPGYWTKERCIEEAKKYKTKNEWVKKSSRSYGVAIKEIWFSEATTHMPNLININGYWTKERCIEEAKKYKTKNEWVKNSCTSYCIAVKTIWFSEATAHMERPRKPVGYWTKERCLEEAKKYKYRNEWWINSSVSHREAIRNSWVEECTAHMVRPRKPSGYWNKERCMEEALKYTNKEEWRVNSVSSHSSAIKKGWVEECTAHMEINKYNELQIQIT